MTPRDDLVALDRPHRQATTNRGLKLLLGGDGAVREILYVLLTGGKPARLKSQRTIGPLGNELCGSEHWCLLAVGLYVVSNSVEELKHSKGRYACEQQGHQQN